MIYWFIGYLLSQSTLSVYMELASYFPSRSGSDVVYLEQAYPYPQYLFPTIFAIKHVIFAFSSSNAIVFSEYLFGLAGSTYTPWQLKGVAVGVYTVALIGLWASPSLSTTTQKWLTMNSQQLVVGSNTKWSLRVVLVFGFIKIATLLLFVTRHSISLNIKHLLNIDYRNRISIAGLVVLGGHTRISDPNINWRDAWRGTSQASAYGATNAMIKLIFSYAGYTNAFGLVNEMQVVWWFVSPSNWLGSNQDIEPHQNTSLECAILIDHRHNSLYPSQRRLLLRCVKRRNIGFQADSSCSVLSETVWHRWSFKGIKFTYLYKCFR